MTKDEFYKRHHQGTLPLQEQVLLVVREAQEPLSALAIAGLLCGRRTTRLVTLRFDHEVEAKLKEIKPLLETMVGTKVLWAVRHKPTIGEAQVLYAPPPP